MKRSLNLTRSLHLIASRIKQLKTNVIGRETLWILPSMRQKFALCLVTSREI